MTTSVLAPVRLSSSDARRFHRRAVLLNSKVGDISAALQHLGFVQIDPINVCGRMHDLILRNRVANYREGDLGRYLHGDNGRSHAAETRVAFEHHLPHSNILVALPVGSWPHLLAAMRDRSCSDGSWGGRLDSRQTRLAANILSKITAEGPVCSEDVDDSQRDSQGWGPSASLAKTTLHKMFFHGQVLISRRISNRRYYDLPQRVLPNSVLNAPEPAVEENRRWLVLLKLRQRRLAMLPAPEVKFVSEFVQPIQVADGPLLYCLREDVKLLDQQHPPLDTMLLAPLDPLIYDRRVTLKLWSFDYTWEVYTPAEKRVRGYYALPLLVEHDIVGHIDPKADRSGKKLTIMKRSVRRGYECAGAIKELTNFLGLKKHGRNSDAKK